MVVCISPFAAWKDTGNHEPTPTTWLACSPKNNLLGDPILLGGMSIPFGGAGAGAGASAKTAAARGFTTGVLSSETTSAFQFLVLVLFVY